MTEPTRAKNNTVIVDLSTVTTTTTSAEAAEIKAAGTVELCHSKDEENVEIRHIQNDPPSSSLTGANFAVNTNGGARDTTDVGTVNAAFQTHTAFTIQADSHNWDNEKPAVQTPALGRKSLVPLAMTTLSKHRRHELRTAQKKTRSEKNERALQALRNKQQRLAQTKMMVEKQQQHLDYVIEKDEQLEQEMDALNNQLDAEDEEELEELAGDLMLDQGEEEAEESKHNQVSPTNLMPPTLELIANMPSVTSPVVSSRAAHLASAEKVQAGENKGGITNASCCSLDLNKASDSNQSNRVHKAELATKVAPTVKDNADHERNSHNFQSETETSHYKDDNEENFPALANPPSPVVSAVFFPVAVSLSCVQRIIKLYGNVVVRKSLNSGFDKSVNRQPSLKKFLLWDALVKELPADFPEHVLKAWVSQQVLPKRLRQNFQEIELYCPNLHPKTNRWLTDTEMTLFAVTLALVRTPVKIVLDSVKPVRDIYPMEKNGKRNQSKNPYRAMGKKKYAISAFGNMCNSHWIHIFIDPQQRAVEVHDSFYHMPHYRELHAPRDYHQSINEILHRYELPLVGIAQKEWDVSIVCDIQQSDSVNCGPCTLMKIWEKFDPSTCPLLWANPPSIDEFRGLIYKEVQKNMTMLGLDPHFEKAVDQAYADTVAHAPGGFSNPHFVND